MKQNAKLCHILPCKSSLAPQTLQSCWNSIPAGQRRQIGVANIRGGFQFMSLFLRTFCDAVLKEYSSQLSFYTDIKTIPARTRVSDHCTSRLVFFSECGQEIGLWKRRQDRIYLISIYNLKGDFSSYLRNLVYCLHLEPDLLMTLCANGSSPVKLQLMDYRSGGVEIGIIKAGFCN